MSPSVLFRPVLVCLATGMLSACNLVEDDPHRFENLANAVAAVPLDGGAPRSVEPARASAPASASASAGLRPALKVEVMDPHALWDARDGLVERAAAAAAPAVADAVVQQVSARIDDASARVGLRPAVATPPRTATGVVQLGAYASEASARAAWARLKAGEAAWALEGLSPVYEAVEVGDRVLTRLMVRAPAAGAAAVCAAARIDDPWCHRAT